LPLPSAFPLLSSPLSPSLPPPFFSSPLSLTFRVVPFQQHLSVLHSLLHVRVHTDSCKIRRKKRTKREEGERKKCRGSEEDWSEEERKKKRKEKRWT
jgi:hypothetical protein